MSLKAPTTSDLFALLDEIAHTLREIGLNTERPNDIALASTAPFCFDTLEFHAWLEWVFLPRMQQTIEQELNLAAPCNIAPLAEYQFATYAEPTHHLLALLAELDTQINAYFDFPMENKI
ncbi:YqcC family protein [Halothiobacillus sp.]|uniref:YqcC family protein n=1 Tax=Halothiobacillus sp. TaxID=1891311 RepID=UPI002613684A|nr:YqcC family protein [Halothiobacillus sp.]